MKAEQCCRCPLSRPTYGIDSFLITEIFRDECFGNDFFIIGGLIFVHEWGHFWPVWAGISIARFSIGFGPRIWSRNLDGIEYCVALIPLGGYVVARIESEEEFFAFPAARRIVFWLGGPIANFVPAGLLLAIVHCIREGISPSGLLIVAKETVRQSLRFILALPSISAHPDQLSGVVGIVAVGKSVFGNGFVQVHCNLQSC